MCGAISNNILYKTILQTVTVLPNFLSCVNILHIYECSVMVARNI